MNTHLGIAGRIAPEFRVENWLANVESDLAIADVSEPVIVLYLFQAACPGCTKYGFPTFGNIRSRLEADGRIDQVRFVAIQTVFEDFEHNTAEAAIDLMGQFGLSDLALGHDVGEPPATMTDYRSGGTPWKVIIGPRPDRRVLFNGFQLDVDSALELIDHAITPAT